MALVDTMSDRLLQTDDDTVRRRGARAREADALTPAAQDEADALDTTGLSNNVRRGRSRARARLLTCARLQLVGLSPGDVADMWQSCVPRSRPPLHEVAVQLAPQIRDWYGPARAALLQACALTLACSLARGEIEACREALLGAMARLVSATASAAAHRVAVQQHAAPPPPAATASVGTSADNAWHAPARVYVTETRSIASAMSPLRARAGAQHAPPPPPPPAGRTFAVTGAGSASSSGSWR